MSNEGTSVNIDTSKVVERLAHRIAELEITVAQQTAVIAALMEERGGDEEDETPEVA